MTTESLDKLFQFLEKANIGLFKDGKVAFHKHDSWPIHSVAVSLFSEWLNKQQVLTPPRPGLVPKSGDPTHPVHWILPSTTAEISTDDIEFAPSHLPELDKRREEAKDRVNAFLTGKDRFGEKYSVMSPEEVILSGYTWRKWAHDGQHGAWDWAMWEEIQKLAKKHGYVYKDRFTKQELLDNPLIPDVDNVLGKETPSIDNETTAWRNTVNVSRMNRFINSEPGKLWHMLSLRDVWATVLKSVDDKILESWPGLAMLRNAKTWEEALSTNIEIYRGILGKKEDAYTKPFVSYTLSPKIAEKFAHGFLYSRDSGPDAGIVVKRMVKFGDILGYLNPDGEQEVLVRPPTLEQLQKGECETEHILNLVKSDIPISTKAIVFNDENKALILKDRWSSWWDLVGGHIDEEETPEQSLIRETLEETGLKISSAERIEDSKYQVRIGKDNHPVVFYRVQVEAFEPINLSREHTDYAWISEKEIPKYNLGVFKDVLEQEFAERNNLEKQLQPPRPGLVPQSGDWNKPYISREEENDLYLEKQLPPRPGLVPKSGDPLHPYRWIRPKESALEQLSPANFDLLESVYNNIPEQWQLAFNKLIVFLEEYGKLALYGRRFTDNQVDELYEMIPQAQRLGKWIEGADEYRRALKRSNEELSRLNKVIAIDAFVHLAHDRGSLLPNVLYDYKYEQRVENVIPARNFDQIMTDLDDVVAGILDDISGEPQKIEKEFLNIRKQNRFSMSTISLGSKEFLADIATTPGQIIRGLSGIDKLEPENKGLLFVFDGDAGRIFHTKGMKFPIDFIWIDSNHKVVGLIRNAPPDSGRQYVSPVPCKYVLEVNAGQSSDINVGDDMILDLKKSEDIEKQLPPRPGLVPKSGDPLHPYRWVRPQEAEPNLFTDIPDAAVQKFLEDFYSELQENDSLLALNMISDYSRIAYGKKVPEENLDKYLASGKNILENATGESVRLLSDKDWKQYFSDLGVPLSKVPEYTVWKLIRDAQTYSDKVIAFDGFMHQHHQNGTYLMWVPGGSDEDSQYGGKRAEIVMDLLNYLAGDSIEKQDEILQPPRPGLVPKSGDLRHPYRWVRSDENVIIDEGFVINAFDNLPVEDKYVVNDYTDQLYGDAIQAYLRSGDIIAAGSANFGDVRLIEKYIQKFDKIISKNILPKTAVVFRVVHKKYVDVNAKQITSPTYLSTTIDKQIADSFAEKWTSRGTPAVVLSIVIPKGTHFAPTRSLGELIFPRNSSFAIKKIDDFSSAELQKQDSSGGTVAVSTDPGIYTTTFGESGKRKKQAINLLKEWIEKNRRGYHTHDSQMPEHPVRVKDHAKWFSTIHQQPSALDFKSSTGPEHDSSDFNELLDRIKSGKLFSGKKREEIAGRKLVNRILHKDFGVDPDWIHNLNSMFGDWVLSDEGRVDRKKIDNLVRRWKNGESLQTQIYGDTYTIKNQWINAYYQLTQAVLKKLYPSGKVTVYRGLYGKKSEDLYNSSDNNVNVGNKKNWTLSSWSLDYGIAEMFASSAGRIGVVVKLDIPVENIFLSSIVFSNFMISSEKEAIVMDAQNFPSSIVSRIKQRGPYDSPIISRVENENE